MDANELGRWTRFASKGGIGKCTATQDCVAEEAEDLMFLKEDEIIVLMQLPGQDDMYLGYCEGVVGRFRGADVHFHGRLKKPVMTKRSSRSLSRSSSRPSSSHGSASPMPPRESLSVLAQRTSPSAMPSRMSHSYSAASIAVTDETSASARSSPLHAYTSPPLPSEMSPSPSFPAPLSTSTSAHDDDLHLRSASHSSGSTALDSAPRTPADFGRDEGTQQQQRASTLVRIVSLSRQVDSPTDLHDEQTFAHSDATEAETASGNEGKLLPEIRRDTSEGTLLLPPTIEPPTPMENAFAELGAETERLRSEAAEREPDSPSWLDTSDLSSRVSIALSDGEVGIGLSLLQDFAGDNEDTVSTRSSVSETHIPDEHSTDDDASVAAPYTSAPAVAEPVRNSLAGTERSSVYSTASRRASQQVHAERPLEEPHPPFAASIRSVGSRSSFNPSITGSDSEYGGEEWEGASDIYDNYRYSRYSVASKMSRFSKSSMYTVASGLGLEPPPPVPTADSARPSLDSVRPGPTRGRLDSATTDSSSLEDVRIAAVIGSSPHSSISAPSLSLKESHSESKRVPPPLELTSSNHTPRRSVASMSPQSTSSPLLHGTFNSPMSSPQHSPAFMSPTSAPLTSPLFSNTPGGAASALRHRLEQERNLSTVPEITHAEVNGPGAGARLSTQPIVVDDPGNETEEQIQAEQQKVQSPRQDQSAAEQTQSPPLSPSVMSEKKRMIETTYYVANQAPPPPYTPMSPVASTSQLPTPVTQPLQIPQQQMQPRPPLQTQPHPQPQQQHPYPPQQLQPRPPLQTQPHPQPQQQHPYPPQQLQPQPQSQTPTHPQVLAAPGQPTLRPVNPERQNNQFMRRSLFAPHPHAPKPAQVPSGPMYGRQPYNNGPHNPQAGPPPGSVMHTMHVALAARGDPMYPRPVTFYGQFEHDLSTALGPVPVWFTLEPPNNVPANRIRTQTSGGPIGSNSMMQPMEPPPGPGASSPPQGEVPPGKVIPRANFFPKAPAHRPRSRSFSGFESPVTEVYIPQESSAQNGSQPVTIPPLNVLAKRSKSAHVSSSPVPPPARPQHAATTPASRAQHATAPQSSRPQLTTALPTPQAAARPAHKPSPLSLSQNNVVAASRLQPPISPPLSPRAPTSPLAQPPVTVPSSTPSSPPAAELKLPSPTVSLGQASSAMTSPSMASPPLPPEPATARPIARQISGSSSGHSTATSPVPTSPTKHHPFNVLRHSRSSGFSSRPSGLAVRDSSPPSRASMHGRPSIETDASHVSETRSVVSPTPSVSTSLSIPTASLRAKLSMPTLKIRTSDRPSLHEERSPTLSLAPSDISDQPTVSVKDMNFELVKPNGQLASISEDGSLAAPLPSPSIRGDATSSLRADSPAFSMISASSSRTGITQPPPEPANRSMAGMSPGLTAVDPQEVEAHRQRELRWISMMASIPASQARKNKKIRKLLWEGVPASVRYLVWAHLTDSKAKRMDGLYPKLVMRERVPASTSIERDVRRVFADEPPLLDGSLVNLLQAYMSMVPDITYSRGLTVIAGRLLMQSPEEDAFWTFVSLMDTHLRPYFFSHPVQMEVDASLFGKAVEANEPSLAKKVFVDMDIPPASLCRPWFMALFMEALPDEHAQRVWDIFLFEGVAFLFRVGLAIIQYCKPAVMASSNRDAVLQTLLHPPVSCLPKTSDAFLEVAASVKLKDDDIRKQRTKLEAQVKRKTQARAHNQPVSISGGPPAISLPRS